MGGVLKESDLKAKFSSIQKAADDEVRQITRGSHSTGALYFHRLGEIFATAFEQEAALIKSIYVPIRRREELISDRYNYHIDHLRDEILRRGLLENSAPFQNEMARIRNAFDSMHHDAVSDKDQWVDYLGEREVGMSLAERREIRVHIFRAVYEASEGRIEKAFELKSVAEQCNLDISNLSDALDYLANLNLLKRHTRHLFGITKHGQMIYEEWASQEFNDDWISKTINRPLTSREDHPTSVNIYGNVGVAQFGPGSINLVNNIVTNAKTIGQSGNTTGAEALRAMAAAVHESHLDGNTERQILEVLEALSEQGARIPAERNQWSIRSAIDAITSLASQSDKLIAAWDHWKGVIAALFS